MPDLINVIKETVSPEGPFGFNTGIRTRGLSQCNEYDQLPDEDKTLINQVRRGKKVELLLYFKNELLLFEHKEAGVALPEEDNKKIGYQVYRYHLSKKNVKDVKDVKDVKGDSSSISFYQQSRMFWLFIGMAIILMGSLGVLMYKINNFDTELKNIASRVDNVSTQLNTEKIANSVATQLPSALKNTNVTKAIIQELNLRKYLSRKEIVNAVAEKLQNRISVNEENLSTRIAEYVYKKITSEDITTILASEIANIIPDEKVANITQNIEKTVVENLTGNSSDFQQKIVNTIANSLQTSIKENLSNQIVANLTEIAAKQQLATKIAQEVANKLQLEGGKTINIDKIETGIITALSSNLPSDQFRIVLKLASKFEKNDNGTWRLKIGNNEDFLSCKKKGWKNYKKASFGKYADTMFGKKCKPINSNFVDQYNIELNYCSGDGRTGTYVYQCITDDSLKQFGISIDKNGNLYYYPQDK